MLKCEHYLKGVSLILTIAACPISAFCSDWPSAVSSFFSVDTSIPLIDTDRDGMPDDWENAHSLNTSVNDTSLDPDGDGASNIQEYNRGTDPQVRDDLPRFALSAPFLFQLRPIIVDTDGDGMPDAWETAHGLNPSTNDAPLDLDNDGLSNLQEYNGEWDPQVKDLTSAMVRLSSPFLLDSSGPQFGLTLDTDGDGMPDWWEVHYGLNRLVNDAAGDPDSDGRSNLDEYNSGTDPQVNDWRGPWIVASSYFALDTGGFWGGYALDSDQDGMPDWWEIIHGLNPHLNDASLNPDGDNLANIQEYNSGSDPQVNDWRGPSCTLSGRFSLYTIVDTDHDGIHDAWEVFYFTNSAACDPLADDDHDKLNNYQEFVAGTDPKDPASVLRFEQSSELYSGVGVVFSWASASNKLYIIERGTNLMTGFQAPLETSIFATPPVNTYTDTTATATCPYFYRIRVNSPL